MGLKFEGAGKAGSKEALEKSLAQSSGDSTWIRTIPANGEITVRFMEEPIEWFEYYEHWGQSVKSYYACIGKDNDCPGCNSADEQSNRRSKRYLANAIDVEASRVIPLKLPVDLVNRLKTRWERYDTIIDRDYTLSRTGQGLNTIYDLDPGEREKMDFDRFAKDKFDYQAKLEEQWTDAWAEAPATARTEVGGTEVDDDDGEEEVITLESLEKMSLLELHKLAAKHEIKIDEDAGKQDAIAAIVASSD